MGARGADRIVAVIRLSARLWAEYTRQVRSGARLRRSAGERWQARVDELVAEHLPLAEKIARQVWRRFTRAGQAGYTSKIELVDMISCAHIGLVEAARRYDATAGDFSRFAYFRVRGAILERYRRNAYRDMQHQSIDDNEKGSDFESSQRSLPRFAPSGIHALRDPGPLPDELAALREMERAAGRAIAELPEDERAVIAETLHGVRAADAAAALGHSAAWGRSKLAAARAAVAAAVQGKRAA